MNNKRLTRIRLSLLLPAGFHTRLACYAACAGISLSEAARRALEAGLPVLECGADPDLAAQLEALEALRCIRAEMHTRYGVYEGDLLAEVRAERERQMDRVWGLARDQDETGDGCGGAGPRFE